MRPTKDEKLKELINRELKVALITKTPTELTVREIMQHIELNGYSK